jgi:phospholipase C
MGESQAQAFLPASMTLHRKRTFKMLFEIVLDLRPYAPHRFNSTTQSEPSGNSAAIAFDEFTFEFRPPAVTRAYVAVGPAILPIHRERTVQNRDLFGVSMKDDPIRHVVHLVLENRSFDQMLGSLSSIYPDLDGVDETRSNLDVDNRRYYQRPTTERQNLKWDPHHEVSHVAIQLENRNSGFVKDFSQQYPDSTLEARQFIMGYYPLDFLPALHPLARCFTVCDRWFSSLPGPTWPNRFFALTGTSNGRVNMPSDGTYGADLPGYFQQTQTTLFDRLNEQAVHWKVYFHDIPQTTVLRNQRRPHNIARYFYIDQFFTDTRGLEADFPQYCLIEPDFMGYEQNDAHPPHDIMKSEKLIADVYNALRANEELWQSTLLIVMFDEHGGFYDHAVPPSATPPDNSTPAEYTFNQLGVRVPALLVSPWTSARVDHTQFDHTSVLKYLTEKWSLGTLGKRVAEANSIAGALCSSSREVELKRITLTQDQLSPPDPKKEEEAFGSLSSHQTALQLLANWLQAEGDETLPKATVLLSRFIMAIQSITERFLDFVLGEPATLPVTIANPDQLARPLQASASDKVARFIMRSKRYAALGIRARLEDPSVSLEQQLHSLHTLALISGRDFHREDESVRLDYAKEWLAKNTSPSNPL